MSEERITATEMGGNFIHDIIDEELKENGRCYG